MSSNNIVDAPRNACKSSRKTKCYFSPILTGTGMGRRYAPLPNDIKICCAYTEG